RAADAHLLTTSRSGRRRPSKSRLSSEAAMVWLNAASRRRSRFVGGELVAACGERLLLSCELVLAGGERAGASGQLLEVEKTGLVGVEQPSARCARRRGRRPVA